MQMKAFVCSYEKIPTKVIDIVYVKGQQANFWDIFKHYIPVISEGIIILFLLFVIWRLTRK